MRRLDKQGAGHILLIIKRIGVPGPHVLLKKAPELPQMPDGPRSPSGQPDIAPVGLRMAPHVLHEQAVVHKQVRAIIKLEVLFGWDQDHPELGVLGGEDVEALGVHCRLQGVQLVA
jgi:hypothetical protein